MDGDRDMDLQAESKSASSPPEVPNPAEEVGRPHLNGTKQEDEASRLQELEANIRDQDDLERELGRQVRGLVVILDNVDPNQDCRPRNCSSSRRTSVITGDWSVP
jgi:hypothetical protein